MNCNCSAPFISPIFFHPPAVHLPDPLHSLPVALQQSARRLVMTSWCLVLSQCLMIAMRKVQARDVHTLILGEGWHLLTAHSITTSQIAGLWFETSWSHKRVSINFTSMGTSQQAGPIVQIILHFPWIGWSQRSRSADFTDCHPEYQEWNSRKDWRPGMAYGFCLNFIKLRRWSELSLHRPKMANKNIHHQQIQQTVFPSAAFGLQFSHSYSTHILT